MIFDPRTVLIQGDISRADAVVLVNLCAGRSVVEFGMGGSTLLLARCAKELSSYDTDLEWYEITECRIAQIPDKTCKPVDGIERQPYQKRGLQNTKLPYGETTVIMRIVFNLHNVGLGNNGGSRTLIRCAETLSGLDAEVIMFGHSRYTWHAPKGITISSGRRPKSDVAIATGYQSVPSVCESDARIKLYYIRGFELWQASEEELCASYRRLRCLVCSEWLLGLLEKHGIEATLLYPGLDFEWFYNLGCERRGVGALYSDRHATKRHRDAIAVAEVCGYDLSMLNRDIIDASPKRCREWYNGLKVWFAPTELEGLHNPPMEAALCGCALVCTDHERSGMSDYAIHGETALVYPVGDLETAGRYVRTLMEDEAERVRLNRNLVDLLRSKIGDRKTNMTRFLDFLGEL